MSPAVSVKSVPIRLIRISEMYEPARAAVAVFGQARMTQASTILEIRIERIERIQRTTSVRGGGVVRVGSGVFLVGKRSN